MRPDEHLCFNGSVALDTKMRLKGALPPSLHRLDQLLRLDLRNHKCAGGTVLMINAMAKA